MRADLINAAITAACDVLAHEVGGPVEAGRPRVVGGPYHTGADVTAAIGLSSALDGTLFLGVSRATVARYAARTAAVQVQGVDDLTQSGIGN